MKPKEYLLQYRRALERVRQIEERLARLYEEAEVQAAAPKEVNVKGSGRKRDRTAAIAVKIADTTEHLNRQRLEALEIVNEISAVIDTVEDPIQSRLLFDRYVAGMSWEQVAEDICFDPVYTRGRLHGTALESVRVIMRG